MPLHAQVCSFGTLAFMLLRTYLYKLLSVDDIILVSNVKRKMAKTRARAAPGIGTRHFAYSVNIWHVARKTITVGN